MVSTPRPELLSFDTESTSSLTSDSEYSTESMDEPAGKERTRIPKLTLLLFHIYEQIGLLYHYSAIFRRPRLGGRYLRSKFDTEKATIPIQEFLHIEHKILAWAAEGEPDTSHDTTLTAQTATSYASTASGTYGIAMRIAQANTRRRAQLMHWSRHPFSADERPAETKQHDARGSTKAKSHQAASEHSTVNTYSSVARSDIFEKDPEPGSGLVPARTEYAESSAGDESASRRVPRVPSEALHSPTFECPYCLMTLDSAPMRSRNTWKYATREASTRNQLAYTVQAPCVPGSASIHVHLYQVQQPRKTLSIPPRLGIPRDADAQTPVELSVVPYVIREP